MVEFIGHGFYNIDIPIVNNAFISGNDLEQYIQGFAPTHLEDRKQLIGSGISNKDEIAKLVEPVIQENIGEIPKEDIQSRDALLEAQIRAIVHQIMTNTDTHGAVV